MERFYCIPQALDFGLTKTGGGAAVKGLWNCLNQEGVDRAENLAGNFALQIAPQNVFGTSLKLHYIWAQATTATTSRAKFSEQKGHTTLITFGFFSIWVFLCATTFRECLHNPFWVTRKSLTICLRPGTAQNSSKALLLLSMHLSLPRLSQGFSSWLHCSQERAFSCPPLLHGFHCALSVAVRTVHRSV